MREASVVGITQVAQIRISCRSGTICREAVLEFMVFPGSSEDLVFSKPQLDDLGFHITKWEVSREALGISFPTVPPDDCAATLRGDNVLRMREHRSVRPVGEAWGQCSLKARPCKAAPGAAQRAPPIAAEVTGASTRQRDNHAGSRKHIQRSSKCGYGTYAMD